MVEDNPLDMENIKQQQDADNELQQQSNKYPKYCMCKRIHTVNSFTPIRVWARTQTPAL
jgi:hypothetical protein